MKRKIKAFTLAEALVTMAVVGVIAALIIPVLTVSVQSKVRANQLKVAQQKFAKSIEQMALNNKIGPYYGTGADATRLFVDELTKFYKVDKICNSTNLVDCFGYKEVHFTNDEDGTLDITTATKGTIFKGGDGSNYGDEYNSDTVGIIGLDGTRFILTFKNDCNEVEPRVFSYNSDATWNEAMSCVSALIDIDGASGPNTLGKDVALINAGSIGYNSAGDCPVKLGDICYTKPFVPRTIEPGECDAHMEEWGLQYCGNFDESDDYAAAAKACGGKENMVTAAALATYFQNVAYSNNDGDSHWGGASGYTSGIAQNMGLIEPTGGEVSIWINGSEANLGNSLARAVTYDASGTTNTMTTRHATGFYAMCKVQ